eukprot:1479457-Alexandrium_andersonii.AAC.1
MSHTCLSHLCLGMVLVCMPLHRAYLPHMACPGCRACARCHIPMFIASRSRTKAVLWPAFRTLCFVACEAAVL